MPKISDLSRKTTHPDKIAKLALNDEALLRDLLSGISPEKKKAPIREISSQALMSMAEQWPGVLLPHWPYFVGLLKSENGFSKLAAIHIIASLARADTEGLFEKAFDVYYDLLDDESVMVASHAAGKSGRLAKAKPGLQSRITRRLLAIDKTHFEPGRRDLIKGYIIQAFDEYMGETHDQKKIMAFVGRQVNCASAKTRKLARLFIQKWREDGNTSSQSTH
jgi:hypothetical protein